MFSKELKSLKPEEMRQLFGGYGPYLEPFGTDGDEDDDEGN